MIFYRPIILLAVLLCCSFCCGAQDDNYVYKDSAIYYEDSAEVTTLQEKQSPGQTGGEEIQGTYTADTLLVNNRVFVEPDSINALKNLKPLSYAKSMDSLLHEYQQKMEKDEIAARNRISLISRFFLSPVTKYFFLILGAVFIFFILYKLFFAEGFLQRSYAKIGASLSADANDQSAKTADYGKLIAQAVSSRNYRMAVRYHYLQSLQKLSSKGAIELVANKTNYQYVSELSGKKYKDLFASLTLHYEYVWYGEFDIDENVFNSIQNKFKQFNSGL